MILGVPGVESGGTGGCLGVQRVEFGGTRGLVWGYKEFSLGVKGFESGVQRVESCGIEG